MRDSTRIVFCRADADAFRAACLPSRRSGRLPRLDARRVRLLRRGLHVRPARRRVRRAEEGDHLDGHHHAVLPPRRRAPLRPPRGPLRPPRAADGERYLLLHHRVALRLLPDVHAVPHPARTVRHRDGRGVGRRRVARDGAGAEEVARRAVRHPQSGYSIGNLLAALAARYVLPAYGWRWMFWIGALPALLALYIRMKVPESKAWAEHRVASLGAMLRATKGHLRGFAYLVLLMTFMMFLSHGTQDLYPDFLKELHHVTQAAAANVAVLYTIGAVVGAVIFGQLSQKLGRRYSMLLALALSLCVIPFWAFGTKLAVLTAGAFVMQMGVQGAWGIIPVHLNELAPDAVRGLMPGLAYQLGILFAAPTSTIEHALRDRFGYGWALAGFELAGIVTPSVVEREGGVE